MSDHNYELHREDFQKAVQDLDTYIDITMEDLLQIHRMASEHARIRQIEQIMVRNLMSRDVVTVNPDTSLKEAAQILLQHRISGLPVIDNNQKLVGIVTEADFLTAIGIPGHQPTHSVWHTLESMFKHKPQPRRATATVATIMVKDIITIQEDKTLHEVIETMKQYHIKRLLVTNEQQQVKGIITRSNLVKVLLQKIL